MVWKVESSLTSMTQVEPEIVLLLGSRLKLSVVHLHNEDDYWQYI